MLRAKRGGFIYRGDLYIRAWELQSESRQRAHQHQRNLCISVSNFLASHGVARIEANFRVNLVYYFSRYHLLSFCNSSVRFRHNSN